jgi:hypothetical protein
MNTFHYMDLKIWKNINLKHFTINPIESKIEKVKIYNFFLY